MTTRWEPYTFAPGELATLLARADGIEVTPCSQDDTDACEPCEEGSENMWSIFLHVTGEGVHCIGDWIVDESDPHGIAHAQAAAFTEAHAMADKMLLQHPQLKTFGIR